VSRTASEDPEQVSNAKQRLDLFDSEGGLQPGPPFRLFRGNISDLRSLVTKEAKAATAVRRARRSRRVARYICYVGLSKSGVFWAILKDQNRDEHFAYGPNFLMFPAIPRIGQQVTFVRLPPLSGSKFPRAIEVDVRGARQ
jgi:hypothetical protein